MISHLPRPARVEGGDTLCLLVRRASFEPDCPRPKQCLSSLTHKGRQQEGRRTGDRQEEREREEGERERREREEEEGREESAAGEEKGERGEQRGEGLGEERGRTRSTKSLQTSRPACTWARCAGQDAATLQEGRHFAVYLCVDTIHTRQIHFQSLD